MNEQDHEPRRDPDAPVTASDLLDWQEPWPPPPPGQRWEVSLRAWAYGIGAGCGGVVLALPIGARLAWVLLLVLSLMSHSFSALLATPHGRLAHRWSAGWLTAGRALLAIETAVLGAAGLLLGVSGLGFPLGLALHTATRGAVLRLLRDSSVAAEVRLGLREPTAAEVDAAYEWELARSAGDPHRLRLLVGVATTPRQIRLALLRLDPTALAPSEVLDLLERYATCDDVDVRADVRRAAEDLRADGHDGSRLERLIASLTRFDRH